MRCQIFLIAITNILMLSPQVLAQKNFFPKAESLKLFNKYAPVIEKEYKGILDEPNIIVGDINGDGLYDCIIDFVLTPKEGGNIIVAHGAAIYINTGLEMKVVGAFPEGNFCYNIDYIRDQVIYVKEHECAPPYSKIIKQRKFRYLNGKVREITK